VKIAYLFPDTNLLLQCKPLPVGRLKPNADSAMVAVNRRGTVLREFASLRGPRAGRVVSDRFDISLHD